MTIYCREKILFGLINRDRKILPGTQERLDSVKLISKPGRTIGRSLIVETEDSVTVRYHGVTTTMDNQYWADRINEAQIRSLPGLKDLLLGIEREYYWRSTSRERL